MPYSFYAVLGAMPQIAAAAVLPILGIAFVSFLIRLTKPRTSQKPVAQD